MALIVNNERIEDEVIEGELARISRSGECEAEGPEKLRKLAVDNVIARTLLHQRAKERFKDIPAGELDEGLRKFFDEQGGKDAFYGRHGLTGADDARVRDQVGADLRVQKLMDEICTAVTPPSDDEVRRHYNEHTDEFIAPARVRASHIVKHPRGPEEAEEAYARLGQVREELLEGADFAELAEKHTECRDEPGGDLGLFPKGQMAESFDAVVFSMRPGEVSPVFLTEFGYHVAKVFERHDAAPRELDEVKDEIAERLLHDRKNDAIGEVVDELQKKATIVETKGKKRKERRKKRKKEKKKRKKKAKKP
jgi:parvulin-like peptidyl-prolyl isomerase